MEPLAALTIATMPALIASGSVGQASQIARKSASAVIGGETATDAFAAPWVGTSEISLGTTGI
jgi:hypothetical protein